MTSLEDAAIYLLRVAALTIAQLFALGGPALILVFVLSKLSGYVRRLAMAALGYSTFLLLFGWLGTSVHETGHLIAALLFRHRIASFRPFAPDRSTGTLGSVGTLHQPASLYQHIGLFFIGIAPVLFGTLVIFLALYALFQDQVYDILWRIDINRDVSRPTIGGVLSSGLSFLAFVFSPSHLLDWRLYLFLYIAFAVGSSIKLSDADITTAAPGCLTFIVLLFLFNTVLLTTGATGDTFAWLTQYYVFLYVLLCFVILLDLVAIAILWLPAAIRSSAAASRHS